MKKIKLILVFLCISLLFNYSIVEALDCGTETVISMPFSKDGAGEYCFVATGTFNYINSWNMDRVEINGKDATNTWLGDIPPASDGKIHIHYVASVSWAHFEIHGVDGGIDPDPTYTIQTSVLGSGTVTGGGSYTAGSIATLTGIPSSGYVFNNWSGDVSGTEASVSVTVNSDLNVIANFVESTTGTISLTASARDGQVGLSWSSTDISNSFEIYRDTDSDPNGRTIITTVANSVTSYTDVSVSNGITYYYWIKSTDVSGNEVNSNAAFATTQGENIAPIANAGSNQTVTDADKNGSETVILDGSASNDSDGSIESYIWTENGSQIATGVNPSVNLSTGTYTITLTVTDNEGASSSDEVTITVSEGTTGNIFVRATGTDGTETLELEVDGSVLTTWTMSTSYQVFTYSGPSTGVFRLNYTNDEEGKDIQVDYLEVSGTTYQAEDQSVNTAFYANGACGGGSHSEMMHCNGYIEFNVGGVCADSDGDGTDDCTDNCPNDPNKINPGDCGCGVAEGSCEGLQFAIPGGNQGLAACKAKFVGNILPSWTSPTIRSDFSSYWNQVTPENAGKWGVTESSRDNYSWSYLDEMYTYCQQNGLPFKQHVFIWGSQQPDWISSLSASDQRAEVEEWYSLFAQRYPNTRIVDVVNESLPGHASAVVVKEALGGASNGSSIPYLSSHPEYGPYGTGWDYIIYAFAKAREYFPNAILVLNDYNIINSSSNISAHLQIVNILKARGLIDAVGIQAHAFSVDNMSASQIKSGLDQLATAGLPIHVTELDIRGDSEQQQKDRYAIIFPAFYEHPAVAGITLWGYIEGTTWMDNTGILNSDGTERLAVQWLKEYMASQPNVCNNLKNENMITANDRYTETSVKVYPNPVTDVLNIEISNKTDEPLTIFVINSVGLVVKTEQAYGSINRIDVSGIPNGLYLIKVTGSFVNYTTLIVK